LWGLARRWGNTRPDEPRSSKSRWLEMQSAQLASGNSMSFNDRTFVVDRPNARCHARRCTRGT
jgi:hypothetical protein